MSGGGGSSTAGFRYYFGIHMGICRGPVDELVEVQVGERSAWPIPYQAPTDDPPDLRFDITIDSNFWASIPEPPEEGGGSGFVPYVVVPISVGEQFSAGKTVTIEGLERRDHHSDGLGFEDYDLSGAYTIKARNSGSLEIYVSNEQYADWTFAFRTNSEPLTESVRFFTADTVIDPSEIYVPPVTSSGAVEINAESIFGGDFKEGGIKGTMHVMMGESNQGAPSSLASMLGAPVPGFRRIFTIFFDGQIAAMNPYPKPWKFRVRRILKGWDGTAPFQSLAKIVYTVDEDDPAVTSSNEIHAMNPAHIIYECLTNREWGRGLPVEAIDVTSFEVCAQTLFDENFGLCLRWTRRDTVQSFIQSIIDHIGAVMYTDKASALLTLRLIRGDYTVSELPLFDEESGLLEIREANVASIGGGGVNEVVVGYRDPITGNEKSVRVHNLASLQASNGAFNSLRKNYIGVPVAALATRLAQRDLRASSTALRRFTIRLDRRGHDIQPAGLFRVRSLSRGIPEMVLRVGAIDNGTLTDGAITISAVQDVFSMPASSFVGVEPPHWTPPNNQPCVGRHRVFELPYAILRRNMSTADFETLDGNTAYFGVALEQGQPLNASYRIAVKTGAIEEDEWPSGTDSYCGYVPPEE